MRLMCGRALGMILKEGKRILHILISRPFSLFSLPVFEPKPYEKVFCSCFVQRGVRVRFAFRPAAVYKMDYFDGADEAVHRKQISV